MTDIYINRDRHRPSNAKPAKHTSSKLSNFNTMLFSFLLGIFSTCLAVFMFSTNDITLKIPTSSKPKPAIKNPMPLVAATESPVVQEPRYDFYTELAKNDVDAVSDLKSPSPTISGYMVEVGAFKRTKEADALRAKLTLNGYTAKVDQLKQKNGEVLHKVVLGTYKQEQNAKAIQQKLKAAGFDSVLVAKYAN